MTATGKMTRLMAKVSIATSMVLAMKGTGRKTNNTGRVLKHGLMELATKVIISKGKSMAKASSLGQMGPPIKDNFPRIISRVMVSINGLMEESTKANGEITRWRAMVSLHGQMVANMKETTWTIKRRAKARSFGPMAGNTMVIGRTESNMALESIHRHRERLREESGTRVREWPG